MLTIVTGPWPECFQFVKCPMFPTRSCSRWLVAKFRAFSLSGFHFSQRSSTFTAVGHHFWRMSKGYFQVENMTSKLSMSHPYPLMVCAFTGLDLRQVFNMTNLIPSIRRRQLIKLILSELSYKVWRPDQLLFLTVSCSAYTNLQTCSLKSTFFMTCNFH